MFSYLLYKLGIFFANALPFSISKYISTKIADIYSLFSKKDFCNVRENLKIILKKTDANLDFYAKEVFRNFALYLLEFFRIRKIDKEFIEKNFKIIGLENFQNELKNGLGLIGLTAHIGNWELLGVIISILGIKINAVALEHKNSLVNKIFIGQRESMGLNVLSLGDTKGCMKALKRNEILALVGDRDFSDNSITLKFFGKDTEFPKGPATLSLRTNSNILPGFLIREKSTFKILLYEPICFERKGIIEEDIEELTKRYVRVLEKIIEQYPTQWLMFRKFYRD